MSWGGYVVCPECKNGFAVLKGKMLICPGGCRFKLIKVEEVKGKRGKT